MAARPHSHVIGDLVGEHGWTRGAEIGVFRGGTLFHLLDRFPALSMIGVDQWRNLPPSNEPGYGTYERHDMAAVGRKVHELSRHYGDRCQLLHMGSVMASDLVRNGELDFVFIDAMHTEAAVRQDIVAWRPKVRAGGWMTGHDWNYPSVAVVLDEQLPGWRRHEQAVWSRHA